MYAENEFEQAVFDPDTGLDAQTLYDKLAELQDTPPQEARQIFCAKAYAYVLDNVQLQINEHTPFSVKINIGVDYSYFATTDVFDKAVFRRQRDRVLSEVYPDDYTRMKDGLSCGLGEIYADYWHTVPNWEELLRCGFAGILYKARASKERLLSGGSYTQKQLDFLDSVILCYEAILRLLTRIHAYSLRFDVPEFSAAVKNLISEPPATLYEAMLFSVLFLYVEEIGCERGRTLGAIDRLYLPFFRKDLESGTPLEELKELLRYFFIHFTATKRFAEQPFTMCGSDEHGNDLSNELSELILETYDEMNIYDPKIHLRYHKNISDRILTKAVSMIRGGNSSICMINDHAVYAGYDKIGIPKSDAWNYVLLGCYEPILIGKEEAEIAVMWLNTAKCVEFALNGGRDILTGKPLGTPCPLDFASFDEFFAAFLAQLDHCMDFAIEFAQKQGLLSTQVNPSPIYSSTFDECLEQGLDVHEYPLKYNNMSLKCFALATTVDALTAVKKYVFDEKRLTFKQMQEAVRNNWKGYEDLQLALSRDADKYGNNRPLPDGVMLEITHHLEEKYVGMKLDRGGVLRLGLDSIYNCVDYGAHTAATPDGRFAGMPVSKNLCASDGKDRGGITAYMQSVLKINSAAFLNSAIFDYVMHPSAVEGEKGLADFKSLLRIFFDLGGFAAQGNIISGAQLREAQLNPEKYATLQVRVCGWNEYFIKLSRVKQDMFIRQCEGDGR